MFVVAPVVCCFWFGLGLCVIICVLSGLEVILIWNRKLVALLIMVSFLRVNLCVSVFWCLFLVVP